MGFVTAFVHLSRLCRYLCQCQAVCCEDEEGPASKKETENQEAAQYLIPEVEAVKAEAAARARSEACNLLQRAAAVHLARLHMELAPGEDNRMTYDLPADTPLQNPGGIQEMVDSSRLFVEQATARAGAAVAGLWSFRSTGGTPAHPLVTATSGYGGSLASLAEEEGEGGVATQEQQPNATGTSGSSVLRVSTTTGGTEGLSEGSPTRAATTRSSAVAFAADVGDEAPRMLRGADSSLLQSTGMMLTA